MAMSPCYPKEYLNSAKKIMLLQLYQCKATVDRVNDFILLGSNLLLSLINLMSTKGI
jgi:hypothetical protein